jgi:hypothetical protein
MILLVMQIRTHCEQNEGGNKTEMKINEDTYLTPK